MHEADMLSDIDEEDFCDFEACLQDSDSDGAAANTEEQIQRSYNKPFPSRVYQSKCGIWELIIVYHIHKWFIVGHSSYKNISFKFTCICSQIETIMLNVTLHDRIVETDSPQLLQVYFVHDQLIQFKPIFWTWSAAEFQPSLAIWSVFTFFLKVTFHVMQAAAKP